jgi:predicted S18 family serine protease
MRPEPALLLAIAIATISLSLSSIAYGACEGSISQNVPAVVGDGGGLVNVSISLTSGPGQVYVTVFPRTGVMTQDSIEQAVSYAYGLAHVEEGCDVLVDFGANPSTSYIDGPSAGTALTVMTYALLENRTLRNDTVITGTIEQDGQVGPVGGLYEKAKGAATKGARYFITPVESIYEMMMLHKMEEQYGIRMLQAQRVEEVIGFMVDNRSIGQESLEVPARDVPDVPPYDSSGMEAFKPVADRMVGLEGGLAASVEGSDNQSEAIRDFFKSEVERQDGIIAKGYFFTAANEAFLNYIDLSTINAIISGDPDLPRKKGDAGICLTGIQRPNLTDRNFEWVAGADERQGWAYERMESTETDDRMLTDEKYAKYNELMYAQAWCIVAKELVSAAPQDGTRINESAWKSIAGERISEARALNPIDAEYVKRLNIAQSNFDAGRYGAAIFDAVYVIENEEAAGEKPGDGNISMLIEEPRASLWGRIYQSHAAFLYAQNESGGAYRTARFAKGLDEATKQMIDGMEPLPANAPETPSEEPAVQVRVEDNTLMFAAAAAVSVFLFLVLLLLLTRRTHGADSAGFGKADRAKQKKGGAPVPGKSAWRQP